jgi:hypothetical protein
MQNRHFLFKGARWSLMGGWCGARTADTTRTKTGMRLQPESGVEGAKRHTTERSGQRLFREGCCRLTDTMKGLVDA